jgi:UDP-N-acetylglucosamine 2-epimerase
LRSFDETMPEEINRLITDRLNDALYTTEAEAEANLRREGVDPQRIVFAGNVMIDSLLRCLPRAEPFEKTMQEAGASDDFLSRARSGYAVATLHRPSNVDHPTALGSLLRALAEIAQKLPIIFPAHPRTQRIVEQSALRDAICGRDVLLRSPLVGTPALCDKMGNTLGVATIAHRDTPIVFGNSDLAITRRRQRTASCDGCPFRTQPKFVLGGLKLTRSRAQCRPRRPVRMRINPAPKPRCGADVRNDASRVSIELDMMNSSLMTVRHSPSSVQAAGAGADAGQESNLHCVTRPPRPATQNLLCAYGQPAST